MLTLLIAFAIYWLISTVAGRDVLLAQIVARLPADSSFTWKSAEGPVSGPLTLRGVRFAYQDTMFTAERIYLEPKLRPLLGRKLRLDSVQVDNATLAIAKSDEPFELPRWPEVLPQIEPPLSLQADDVRAVCLDAAQGETIEAVVAGGERFDIVLAMEVVEHVADRAAFLRAAAEAVRPGGLLFAATINRTLRSFALAIVGAGYVLRWLPRGTHDWEKFVTPAELTADLMDLGLPVEVNDLTALRHMPLGRPFWVGPLVNVYNEGTLRWLAKRGASESSRTSFFSCSAET